MNTNAVIRTIGGLLLVSTLVSPAAQAQQIHPIDPSKLALPTATPTSPPPILPPPSKMNLTLPTPTPAPLQLTPPSKVFPGPTPEPTRSPAQNQVPGAFAQDYIAPPTQVQTTGDPSVCAAHSDFFGGWLCSEAFQSGLLVLVWGWQSPDTYHDPATPNTQYRVIKDIDGFHAYQVVPSLDRRSVQHTLVSTAHTGETLITMTAFDAPQPSYFEPCYVVRAFKGQLESADSQPFCMGSGTGQQASIVTVQLAPMAIRTIRHAHHSPLDLPTCPPFYGWMAGYVHCNDGADQEQEVSRVLFQFDLSSLGPVYSAILTFHREGTWLMGTDPEDNNQASDAPQDEPLHGRTDANCARELLLPTYDWVTNGWDDSDPDSSSPVTSLPTVDYAPVPLFATDPTFDVTDQVIRWRVFPASNNGFALRGGDEDTGKEDNDRCQSLYTYFELTVTHLASAAGGSGAIDNGSVGVPGAP